MSWAPGAHQARACLTALWELIEVYGKNKLLIGHEWRDAGFNMSKHEGEQKLIHFGHWITVGEGEQKLIQS